MIYTTDMRYLSRKRDILSIPSEPIETTWIYVDGPNITYGHRLVNGQLPTFHATKGINQNEINVLQRPGLVAGRCFMHTDYRKHVVNITLDMLYEIPRSN